MGRSQVKYRTTHGRGQGRGRGRGDGGTGGRRRGDHSHLRNLDSNAYRFEEQDDEPMTQSGRTQLFALKETEREKMGGIHGEYFQSRTMKQWEVKDDTVDDHEAAEMLDLKWITSQLELVSPSIRYRIDPKYCTDLPFEHHDEDERELNHHVVTDQLNAATSATPLSKAVQGNDELDVLLHLSASTSSRVKSTSSPSVPWSAASASTATAVESEQLEEWLDDVLDM